MNTLAETTLTAPLKARNSLIKFADRLRFVAGDDGPTYLNIWSRGAGQRRRLEMFSGPYARSHAFQEIADARDDERKGYSSGEDYLETMIVQPHGKAEFVHFLYW